MKNLVYIVTLFFTFSGWSQSKFDRANELYKNEKYSEAAILYEEIVQEKTVSADLYYNLGNAYYKLRKVGPAIYNYEKALLLNPDDEDVRNNLKFAQKLQIDEIEELPRVGFEKMVHNFTSVFSVNGWAWISIVFSFMVLAFFTGYYFSEYSKNKRIFFIGMSLSSLLIFVALFGAYFTKTASQKNNYAIIMEDVVSVKAEPNADSPVSFQLHEGSKVEITESMDGWKKIQLPSGSKGWITDEGIKYLR